MAVTYPRILWPVTITAGVNDNIVFDEGAGNLSAAITVRDYVIRGSGAVVGDELDLLREIETRMDIAGGNYNVTISDTGRVTISDATSSQAFTIHWATDGTGVTAAVGRILGFDVSADDTGNAGNGYSITGDYQCRYAWYPEKYLLDGYRYRPGAFAASAESMGGQVYAQQWMTRMRGAWRIDYVEPGKIRYHDAVNIRSLAAVGDDNEAFTTGYDDDIGGGSSFAKSANLAEGFYEWARRGGRFELHPDVATHTAFVLAVIDPEAQDWLNDLEAAASVMDERGERYRVTIPWRVYVAA